MDIGDKLKRGELLFALDDTDLQTEKAQRMIEIEGARLQVTGARLAMEKVELSFNRNKDLFDSKLVSKEVFDNTANELEVAKNAYEISKNNLARSAEGAAARRRQAREDEDRRAV